jgi:hypothetical protein
MYSLGDRVVHQARPDWGVGEIRGLIGASQVKVFFVNAGEKLLDLQTAKLTKVYGEEAAHPALDNPQPKKTTRSIKPKSNRNKKFPDLQAAVHYFVRLFPEGFYGADFLENERNYKLEMTQRVMEILNKETMSQLLEAGNYDEICSRALHLLRGSSLAFHQEKVSFNNALKENQNKKPFSDALFGLLYGAGEFEARFKAFSDCLEQIGADKWTVATYFPYFRYPNEHIFLKPMATLDAAAVCDFDLNYSPKLNWLTYLTFTKFAQQLFVDLEAKGLKPRDMIDVQSFIWCIYENSYKKVATKES